MSSVNDERAYFVALGGDRYMPTEHSSGAWREDELHLAPVAGLLIHCLERWRLEHADSALQFSRVTIEVLGQIAREQIDVSIEVVRPGRTIALVEAIAVIAGRATIRARAWLLQTSDTSMVEGNAFAAMPPLESCKQFASLKRWSGGFIGSIDAVEPPGNVPGRSRAWITSTVQLVQGEASTPLANFAKLLDTANGIGPREDPTVWFFPNVDLSLHFFRMPRGAHVGLDGRVAFGPNGIGLTSTVMHDLDGPVGVIQQSLTLRTQSPETSAGAMRVRQQQ